MEVRVPLDGQRHIAVTQTNGDGDGDDRVGFGGAVSVTIVFDPRSKATAETLETAADPGWRAPIASERCETREG